MTAALGLALLLVQAPVPAPRDSNAARRGEVQRLVDAHRWAEALAVLAPLKLDSAGHVLAGRLAVNAGVDALAARDTAGAEAFWGRAVREAPGVPAGAGDLAALLLARGRGDSAFRVAERGLRASPGDARLTNLLRFASPLAAAALYDTLLHGRRPREVTYVAASALWRGLGKPKVAVGIADTGLTRFPRSEALWRELAEAEILQIDTSVAAGDTAGALTAARVVVAHGAPRSALLAVGARAATLGTAGAGVADTAYRTVLKAAPEDATALDGAAAVALSRGDSGVAVSLYRRNLSVDSGGPEAPLALLHLTRPAGDSARDLLLAALWRGIGALESAELAGAAAARDGLSPETAGPLADRRRRADHVVRAILDTVVFETSWGPGELDQLERAHPGSPLLARYAADLAVRQGRDSQALARYDDLLSRQPGDADLQRRRAAVLVQGSRLDEARDAYTRALELEPEDSVSFRALVRLDEPAGRLTELLAQVQRLRIRMPDSRTVAEREIELLQRLGRVADARAAADRLAGRHS